MSAACPFLDCCCKRERERVTTNSCIGANPYVLHHQRAALGNQDVHIQPEDYYVERVCATPHVLQDQRAALGNQDDHIQPEPEDYYVECVCATPRVLQDRRAALGNQVDHIQPEDYYVEVLQGHWRPG